MTEHTATVVMLPGAEFQAICSCDWASRPTESDLTAAMQAEQHLSYHAEVATLTAPRED
jgi:hypothetical protein